MYSTISLTNGSGISAARLEKLVQLFDEVRELSPEYEGRFASFALGDLVNLSQSTITTSSSSASEDEETTDKIDPQINDVLMQIFSEVSKGITNANTEPSQIQDIILQHSGKLAQLLKAANIADTANTNKNDDDIDSSEFEKEPASSPSASPAASPISSKIHNKDLAQEMEQLDAILENEKIKDSSSGIFSNLLSFFTSKSNYISDDFNIGN